MSEYELEAYEMQTGIQRAYFAYKDRLAGDSWAAIASNHKYATASNARVEVTKVINLANEVLDNEYKYEMIHLELQRLDTMQKAVWDDATSGNFKAIETVLKIMAHRAKLANIGQGDDNSDKTQTIIVTNDNYVTRLKEISSDG